jgi:hypothetical protein
MSEFTLEDVIEMMGVLKTQQQADSVVIKCLISAVAHDIPIQEAWTHQVSHSVVEEQLYAQTNKLAGATLEDFKDRMNYWDGIVKSITDAP